MPTRVSNQAIPLYNSTDTLFNDKTSRCEWHEDYYPMATTDDVSEIIIDNPIYAENVGVDSEFSFVVTGLTTGALIPTTTVTAAASTFITDNVAVGMYVMIYTTDVNSLISANVKILSVDSETQLTVDASYTPSAVGYFEVSRWNYDGDVRTANNYAEFQLPALESQAFIETAIKDNFAYKVTFTVTFIDPDSSSANLSVRLGNQTIFSLFGDDIKATQYVAHGISDGTEMKILVDAATINIDSVIVSEMYTTSFEVKECTNDSIVYTSVEADVSYSTESDQLKLSFDWDNLTGVSGGVGCYYIEVTQEPEPDADKDRVTDGDFISGGSGWTLGTGWSIISDAANVNAGAGIGGDLIQSTLAYNLEIGVSYDFNFDVLGFVSGSIKPQLYSGGVQIMGFGSFNADGSYSVDTGILAFEVDEIQFVVSGGSPNDYSVDNISIIKNTTSEMSIYRTNCFELTDNTECSVKLTGTNFDNAFNIDFESLGYSPTIRVKGELTTPTYDGDKENEEDSLGISNTLYFKSETKRKLFLYQLPVFHHDFIRLLIGYDEFKVDDVEYIAKESSYEPESERILGKTPDLSNSTTELRLKDDLNVNKFC